MGPISPWRETCDIPLSQRPPPSRRQRDQSPPSPGVAQPTSVPDSDSSTAPSMPANTQSPMHHTVQDATLSAAPFDMPVLHSAGRDAPVSSGFPIKSESQGQWYPRPDPRMPLAILYERNHADLGSVEEAQAVSAANRGGKEVVDVACMTSELDELQHRDVECQTEPQDEMLPEWLDKTVVERELREGRDERLKEYVMRFRHSVAAAWFDHGRVFFPPKRFVPGSLLGKRGHFEAEDVPASIKPGQSGRAEFARATKLKAKEKIKSWYQDGAALDSQTDSQAWLDGVFVTNREWIDSIPSTPTCSHVLRTASKHLTSPPSTPSRTSSTMASTSSPFVVWGTEPGVDASPLRFTTQLSQLRVVCGTARESPQDLSFADLDALLEYQTKLNALLTEDLVVTHAKLFAMEDKLKAYSIYYGFHIDQ
ncbi:hypothetical protein D9619_008784 [Psilocybe cf. subviscida]|uniref:Uncharacterized protein n=1 Tax=Psilocybe cf. subviscida TaxID=2480587 RepID=A0A8H5B9H8_9AGAR|nr:hypothetical protein D9619_008784 [Psilocybe cf. subviscida]